MRSTPNLTRSRRNGPDHVLNCDDLAFKVLQPRPFSRFCLPRLSFTVPKPMRVGADRR